MTFLLDRSWGISLTVIFSGLDGEENRHTVVVRIMTDRDNDSLPIRLVSYARDLEVGFARYSSHDANHPSCPNEIRRLPREPR